MKFTRAVSLEKEEVGAKSTASFVMPGQGLVCEGKTSGTEGEGG